MRRVSIIAVAVQGDMDAFDLEEELLKGDVVLRVVEQVPHQPALPCSSPECVMKDTELEIKEGRGRTRGIPRQPALPCSSPAIAPRTPPRREWLGLAAGETTTGRAVTHAWP